MDRATAHMSADEAVHDAESLRRKRRQGSDNRRMRGHLSLRYDPAKLFALKAVAGTQLPNLMRDCGDLLTKLIPEAQERGIDPVVLLRQATVALMERGPARADFGP